MGKKMKFFFSVGALSQLTPSELGTSLALPWVGAYFRNT
jgi:hypothetical protein